MRTLTFNDFNALSREDQSNPEITLEDKLTFGCSDEETAEYMDSWWQDE